MPTCTSNGAPGSAGNSGCFADVGTFPGTTVKNPGVQPAPTSFYQDTVRETKQTAFFASLDYDLIPKVLTITAGTRHFRFDNTSAGSVLASFGCFQGGAPAGGCHNPLLFLQSQCGESQRHRVRLQEPREYHLAHHAGHHGVLHLLAGLSAGRLQSERRIRHAFTAGHACRSTSFPSRTPRIS